MKKKELKQLLGKQNKDVPNARMTTNSSFNEVSEDIAVSNDEIVTTAGRLSQKSERSKAAEINMQELTLLIRKLAVRETTLERVVLQLNYELEELKKDFESYKVKTKDRRKADDMVWRKAIDDIGARVDLVDKTLLKLGRFYLRAPYLESLKELKKELNQCKKLRRYPVPKTEPAKLLEED